MVIFVVIHYAVTKAHQQYGICIATKPHMPLLWQDCESLSKLFFPLNSSLRGYKTLAEGASLVFGNCYALVEARGWKCGSSSVMSVRGGLSAAAAAAPGHRVCLSLTARCCCCRQKPTSSWRPARHLLRGTDCGICRRGTARVVCTKAVRKFSANYSLTFRGGRPFFEGFLSVICCFAYAKMYFSAVL